MFFKITTYLLRFVPPFFPHTANARNVHTLFSSHTHCVCVSHCVGVPLCWCVCVGVCPWCVVFLRCSCRRCSCRSVAEGGVAAECVAEGGLDVYVAVEGGVTVGGVTM